MLKNKDERNKYMLNEDNWQLIESIDELGIAYFKMKEIPEFIKRTFQIKWNFDLSNQPHLKVEYYVYDVVEKVLTQSCMTDLIERMKIIKEERGVDK